MLRSMLLCALLLSEVSPSAVLAKRRRPQRYDALDPQPAKPETVAPNRLIDASGLSSTLSAINRGGSRLRFELRLVNGGVQPLSLIFHYSKAPVEITIRDRQQRVVWQTVYSRTATTGRYYQQTAAPGRPIVGQFSWRYDVRYQTDSGETVRRRRVKPGTYTITARLLLDTTYYVRNAALTRTTAPTMTVLVK